MELIEFTDDFKTGLETIDYEHQKLVTYLNNIISALDMGDAGRLVVEINLDELVGYTVFHFKHEEELMEKFNFKEVEEHKKSHERLKETVLEFKKRFEQGHEIAEDLVQFLMSWLLHHIKGTDRQYISLFKENGVI